MYCFILDYLSGNYEKKKNISQQDLAAACNFEKSNMSRIEAGRNNLTIGTLLKICNVLKVKLKDIVDIE